MIKIIDLFSGIGGISLGLERTGGFETACFCEIEPYPRKVLAKHWPDVPIYEDVRELNNERLRADGVIRDGDRIIVTAGFPCQDISTAGKGAGIKEGTRSGLWFEVARIVGDIRPDYVLLENVAAILGRGIDTALGDLAEIGGYDCEWHCIPASAVGAPHRRDRWWCVAWNSEGHVSRPKRGVSQGAASITRGGRGGVADSHRKRGCGGNSQRENARHAWQSSWGARFHARRMEIWDVEPNVGGSLDGLPVWLYRHTGRGLSYAESQRRVKNLCAMWSRDAAEAVWKATGGLGRMETAAVLFAFLRQYPERADIQRVFDQGAEALERILRDLRQQHYAGSTSSGRGQNEQQEEKHTDAVRQMSCAFASWDTFEGGITRVTNWIPKRVDRLGCLGNSVVPQIPELIGRAILEADL